MTTSRPRTILMSLTLTLIVGGGAGLSLARQTTAAAFRAAPHGLGSDAQLISHGKKARHRDFIVSGAVRDLWPGVPKPLDLTITNVNREPIHLLTLDAESDNPRGCKASKNLRITTYDAANPGATQYTVPANGTAVVPLQITLLDVPQNQRSCQNVTFRLTYSGTAEGTGGGR